MTAVVIDASVALAWCFVDETTPYAESVLEALTDQQAVVPALWALEVANVLSFAKRKKRITASQFTEAVAVLRDLPLQVEPIPVEAVFERIVPLAERHGLTIYDATYLDVALRFGLPLAALDADLKEAAASVGVPAFGAPR